MSRSWREELLNIPGLILCLPPARANLVIRNLRQVPVLPYVTTRGTKQTIPPVRQHGSPYPCGWHYVVGELRAGANDEYTAARATITFATTTGIAPMRNP